MKESPDIASRKKPMNVYSRKLKKQGMLQTLLSGEARHRLERPAAVYPLPTPADTTVVKTGRSPDLVIDFGTSAIAMALIGGGMNAIEILEFDGKRMLDSPFNRRHDLGRSALSENYTWRPFPEKEKIYEFYPYLKRRVELLARSGESAGWQDEAILDVAALCCKAVNQARDSQGRSIAEILGDRTFTVYITVPNNLPRAGIKVLTQGVGHGVAAALAQQDIPHVEYLLEAEAVAFGVVAEHSLLPAPKDNKTVLVIDAGAGTIDASIVRAQRSSLRVLAHVGLPIGGLDLDVFMMALRGDFDSTLSDPTSVGQHIRTAKELKETHLSSLAPSGPNGSSALTANDFKTLATELQRKGWPPKTESGAALEEELARGFSRYLSFGVRSLVASLPGDELRCVDKVVISGRASLLRGFREAVKTVLSEKEVDREPKMMGDPEDLKLAVVRGVGTFLTSTFQTHEDRRPVRSSFEIVLRHSGTKELRLLEAGRPLIDGWGVEAWYQPLLEQEEARLRSAVEMRLIPHSVLLQLKHELKEDDLEEELKKLVEWSSVPLLRIEKAAPFSARFAFNFLTLEVLLDLDNVRQNIGERSHEPRDQAFGRRHPVHRLHENWFDVFHRGQV